MKRTCLLLALAGLALSGLPAGGEAGARSPCMSWTRRGADPLQD